MEKKIGYYSFVIGAIIALVLGLAKAQLSVDAAVWLMSLLIVLGLIVGFLNVEGKETKEFLMVALVLVVVAQFGGSTVLGEVWKIGPFLKGIFDSLIAFIVPATIVVGLRDVLRLAQP